ncbi:MAG: hypothetical protein NVSMB13_00990 [Mycobacteriales bacterium]
MTAASTPGHTSAQPSLRYTLPAAGGTIWLGLRASSLALLALGIASSVGAVLAGAPLLAAAGLLALTGLVATVPVAGRTPLGWAPAVAEHTLRRLTAASRWAADPLADDIPLPFGASTRPAEDGTVRLAVPAEYGRLQLSSVRSGGPEPIAILHGADRHRATVVFEVVGTDRQALLDPAAQDSQLARWGSCLSALGADPRIVRWQWLTHTRPDTRTHSDADHGLRPADADIDRDTAAEHWADSTRPLLADYAQLVAAVRAASLDHRHLLAVTLRTDGNGRRDLLPPAVVEPVRDLAAVLLGADLLSRPLSASELGSVLRLLTDPTLTDRTRPDRTTADHPPTDRSPNDPAHVVAEDATCSADPRRWTVRSRRASWDSCRTDDSWHRSYAVTGWPRLALPADWLAPLLHTPPPPGTARTLAVHAVPIAPQHAARRARAASARAALDAADRSRLGLTGGGAPSAADSLAASDAAQLEAELVAGYRLMHLTAFLTVTATDPQRLAAASDSLRTLAVTHRLDLRPLHGQHPHGLVATLPLGMRFGDRR